MSMIRTARLIAAILFCLSAAAALCAQTTPITLGVTTRTGTTGLPFVIAEERGFFKNEGINGIIVDTDDSESVGRALLAMAADAGKRQAYGGAAARIIQNFSLHTWATSLTGCALTLHGEMNRKRNHG